MFPTMEREMQAVYIDAFECQPEALPNQVFISFISYQMLWVTSVLCRFFLHVACFCRTSLMKVRRTLEKLLRWRAKWINMGQRVKTEIQSKLTDLARQWILPYATGEKKALLERATKESCTQKTEFCIQRGYVATVATWQLTGPRPVQLEWLPYDWETNGPDARNTEISACKGQCWGVDTCWLQKGKKLDGNLNSALNFLQFSEVHVFETTKLDRWYCA